MNKHKNELEQSPAFVSLLGLEEVRTPFQDALYATGRFSPDQCEQLTDGLLQYIDDAGLVIVRQ